MDKLLEHIIKLADTKIVNTKCIILHVNSGTSWLMLSVCYKDYEYSEIDGIEVSASKNGVEIDEIYFNYDCRINLVNAILNDQIYIEVVKWKGSRVNWSVFKDWKTYFFLLFLPLFMFYPKEYSLLWIVGVNCTEEEIKLKDNLLMLDFYTVRNNNK
jgi:hypothetical protein